MLLFAELSLFFVLTRGRKCAIITQKGDNRNKEVSDMTDKKMVPLEEDELSAVSGGMNRAKSEKKYVTAKCSACGTTGEMEMTGASSAICSSCGATINLRGQ